jgi:hypothetical protein
MILNENQMEIKENTYFLSEVSVHQSMALDSVAHDIYARYGVDIRKKVKSKSSLMGKDFWFSLISGTGIGGAAGILVGTGKTPYLPSVAVAIVVNQLIHGFVRSKDVSQEDYDKMIAAIKAAEKDLRSKASKEQDEKAKKKLIKGADRMAKQVKQVESLDYKKKISNIFKKKEGNKE